MSILCAQVPFLRQMRKKLNQQKKRNNQLIINNQAALIFSTQLEKHIVAINEQAHCEIKLITNCIPLPRFVIGIFGIFGSQLIAKSGNGNEHLTLINSKG